MKKPVLKKRNLMRLLKQLEKFKTMDPSLMGTTRSFNMASCETCLLHQMYVTFEGERNFWNESWKALSTSESCKLLGLAPERGDKLFFEWNHLTKTSIDFAIKRIKGLIKHGRILPLPKE